jgi:hypothetical protein
LQTLEYLAIVTAVWKILTELPGIIETRERECW